MGHAPGCFRNAGAFYCLRDLVYRRKLYSQEKSLLKETFFILYGNFYALIDKRKPTQGGLDGVY